MWKCKNLFFTLYSIRVKCEELFCKTNIKLLKLIKKINFVKVDDIQLKTVLMYLQK